jgi:hypothetical protein
MIIRRDMAIRLPRNPSGTGWPTCFKCYQPVEEYGVIDEPTPNEKVIRARCSHKTNKIDSEEKRITVRGRWSLDKQLNEISKLVFFVPNVAIPEGGIAAAV